MKNKRSRKFYLFLSEALWQICKKEVHTKFVVEVVLTNGGTVSGGRKPVFKEPSSGALVITTDELIVSAHGGSMCGKPVECTNALSTLSIHKLQ